jgi:hypothetical protein
MNADDLTRRIRRDLNNMRAFIRRDDLTGWVKERSIAYGYENAFANLVRLEDLTGVTPDVAKLGDRLTALRQEAQRAGLITPTEISEAEHAAITTVDAEKERSRS